MSINERPRKNRQQRQTKLFDTIGTNVIFKKFPELIFCDGNGLPKDVLVFFRNGAAFFFDACASFSKCTTATSQERSHRLPQMLVVEQIIMDSMASHFIIQINYIIHLNN